MTGFGTGESASGRVTLDLTGARKEGSNCRRGSGGAGKNGARVTNELILITNEYTSCGELGRRAVVQSGAAACGG
jgi:hypothetical protein